MYATRHQAGRARFVASSRSRAGQLFVAGLTTYHIIGEIETRSSNETEMVFGDFEGEDVRSGSFTTKHF